jgi:CheY-like chemotaxis protein/cytochrome c-type biogenesis protein CcmH/NrfG
MLEYKTTSFLIVDDLSEFRSSVKSMLRELGATDVDTAASGEEALSMCNIKRYDVILNDYNLGAGKNGQQVLEELALDKLISHHGIFIMVTAESSQSMVLSAIEHEPDAYLIKPFNRASLMQRLNKLAERKKLLKPVLQALDEGQPAGVLNACKTFAEQHERFALLCLRYKAYALRDLGQQAELEQMLDSLLEEHNVPWVYMALGSLLLKGHQYERAQDIYERALREFPKTPGLYDGLSAALAARGETQRAQSLLEEAILLSPQAVQRQMHLGKLALGNKDLDNATKAYRNAVHQGRNSRVKNPESNLGLAQALIENSGKYGPDKRIQKEISQVLSAVAGEHSDDHGLQVRILLMQAYGLHKAGDSTAATKLTEQAVSRVETMEQFFSSETALEVAHQLQQLGNHVAGEAILKNCAEIYGDDPSVAQSIALLTDDPAIVALSTEAAELNRNGVRCYQAGKLIEASVFFKRALALQPKNISIALNTAQSLLSMANKSSDSSSLEECRACLRVAGMMPETDPRYGRYQQMNSMVSTALTPQYATAE